MIQTQATLKIDLPTQNLLKPATVLKAANTALVVLANEIVNELEKYPPTGQGNRPGRFTAKGRPIGYYERNRGYWSPRVNIVRGSWGRYGKAYGRIKGSKIQRETGTVGGYVLTSHSEQLGKKWIVRPGSNQVRITNSASYAPYVQSQAKQSNVMRHIGWSRDMEVARQIYATGVFQKAFWRVYKP